MLSVHRFDDIMYCCLTVAGWLYPIARDNAGAVVRHSRVCTWFAELD